ncbi:Acyl-coenzyme A thioesterase 9, mitochondrial [Pseudolycoriella hygida]|uniref:Acyl-coenzyme A thioesterase 9, mitochondrial n=1 Tax=Pseudolycoriella hygida TaxID=35572 RepID=A0A9Q0N7K7_9DIPT|nr:Acyl-coenzyme A thioesterase 9, mitochondrial [Pseudolycoriella hygida]
MFGEIFSNSFTTDLSTTPDTKESSLFQGLLSNPLQLLPVSASEPSSRYHELISLLIFSTIGWIVKLNVSGPQGSPCCHPTSYEMMSLPKKSNDDDEFTMELLFRISAAAKVFVFRDLRLLKFLPNNYIWSRHSLPTSTSKYTKVLCRQLSEDIKSKEAIAGTMNEVKCQIVKKLGIQTNYSPLVPSREHLLSYEPKSAADLPPRSMQDSFTSAIIPLSTDKNLQDKYVTFLGHVRLGRLMEDMDLFAVWVMHQHVKMPNLDPNIPLPYTFVTILVDKISFTDVMPKHDSDIRLSGHASWVGKSSVEVVVWLEQKFQGRWRKLTRALFLMASRNATNTKALAVNELVPATDDEKIIYNGGETRKQNRILNQQQSLFNQEPNDEEQKMIHEMFVKTIDMKNLTFNQRILPKGAVWMEDGTMSNIIFSHPEDRNAHNTVFGGFLMRHALELSWTLAYQFSKHRPKLEHISDIRFLTKVEVSSLLKMHAHVIYTERNYVEIVVAAEVFDASTGGHCTTNVFYYTYSINVQVPQVIPKTYHEAMWYLDGRRHFNDAMGLDKNKGEPTLQAAK